VTSVVPYFQVHQPHRLRRYTAFDVGRSDRYFDDAENRRIVERVAARCYEPATTSLLRLVERHGGRFRLAFSVSGTALDQMERWAPRALDGFVRLARTGAVEFLAETSHHSLAFLEDPREFERQVTAHAARVEAVFGRRPTTFRNTELTVDARVARAAEGLGFSCLLAEGAERLLRRRSPHRVYGVTGCRALRVLLRSYRLSDDVAFRFGDRGWSGWPLAPATYAGWLAGVPGRDPVVGLFMDFETFGEHQPAGTGIFEFLDGLPAAVLARDGLRFESPAEAARGRRPSGRLRFDGPVSWADQERDLTAWLGNAMQREAHRSLHALGRDARRAARAGRPRHLEAWRRLSTSDHYYYMCTKWASDGDVHRYFSPFETPHDAHIAFMNVVDDLARRVGAAARPARRRPREAGRPPRRARSGKGRDA
jgi:alpha-amylase